MDTIIGYTVDILEDGQVINEGVVEYQHDTYCRVLVNKKLINLTYEEFKINMLKNPKFIPKEIKKVLRRYKLDEMSYRQCENLLNKLEPLGYTFNWGLDGLPIDLVKIT